MLKNPEPMCACLAILIIAWDVLLRGRNQVKLCSARARAKIRMKSRLE